MAMPIRAVPRQQAIATTRPVMDRAFIFLSRLVNILTFGSPRELFCTRAYRNGWKRTVYVIDAYFVLRGERLHHCHRSYAWDVWFNGRPR